MLCGPPVDVVLESRAAHGHSVSATCSVALDSALFLIHQWPIPLRPAHPCTSKALKHPTRSIFENELKICGPNGTFTDLFLCCPRDPVTTKGCSAGFLYMTSSRFKYRGLEMHIYQTHQIPFWEINKPNQFAGTTLRSTGYSWCPLSALAWPLLRYVSVVI